MAKDTSLTFFGSGPVAAQSLQYLVRHFSVEVVVTKEVSREEMATIAPQAKIYTAENKKELTNLIVNQEDVSPVGIIVDFGIILEKRVIDHFPNGIINSHFSLLPKWRGADPITFTVLQGDAKTGVSLMLINEQLDEGLLLAQQEVTLDTLENTPSLTKKLIALSNTMLSTNIPRYLSGKLQPFPQDDTLTATYSRKLAKQDGKLDWGKPAVVLEREIRAYIEWPKSFTAIKNKPVIITKAHVVNEKLAPGTIVVRGSDLLIGCQKGSLAIDALKPAGKNEMDSTAFLSGYKQQLGL